MRLGPENSKQFTIASESLNRADLGVDYYSALRRPYITLNQPIALESLDSDLLNDLLRTLSSGSPQCGVNLMDGTDRLSGKEFLVVFRAGDSNEIQSGIFQANRRSGVGSLMDRWSEKTDIKLEAFEVVQHAT